MIEATATPDGFTWMRTALALAFFLFFPGWSWLSGGSFMRAGTWRGVSPFPARLLISDVVESVVASMVLLAVTSMVLVFTVGLSLFSLLAAYALLAGLGWVWWTFKGS